MPLTRIDVAADDHGKMLFALQQTKGRSRLKSSIMKLSVACVAAGEQLKARWISKIETRQGARSSQPILPLLPFVYGDITSSGEVNMQKGRQGGGQKRKAARQNSSVIRFR
jgi:hypothetical protein